MYSMAGVTIPRKSDDALVVFGQAVSARRKALGLSQEDLAHRAGLNRTYITDIERGARNIALRNIVKLADALGVAPGALLSGVGEKREQAPLDGIEAGGENEHA